MNGDRIEQDELRIQLSDPDELFDYGRPDVAKGKPGSYPGIDRIRNELNSGSRRKPVRLAVVLPSEHITAETERGIREAVVTYCDAGIKRAEQELSAAQRDGWQTLLLGAVILAAGLALSTIFTESKWPQTIRVFFGDGVFLVAAWVGLWYPLDTLVYAGRPYRVERKLLRAIRDLEIAVRPADEDTLSPASDEQAVHQ